MVKYTGPIVRMPFGPFRKLDLSRFSLSFSGPEADWYVKWGLSAAEPSGDRPGRLLDSSWKCSSRDSGGDRTRMGLVVLAVAAFLAWIGMPAGRSAARRKSERPSPVQEKARRQAHSKWTTTRSAFGC